jgi:hypothetical protein
MNNRLNSDPKFEPCYDMGRSCYSTYWFAGLGSNSEIKLIDVLFGEFEWLAEQDVVSLDRNLAQPAGLD